MSGVAGADRIKSRSDYDRFFASYRKLIANFPGFVDMRSSGSYNSDETKQDFGDMDLIVLMASDQDKVAVKRELQSFFQKQPMDVITAFTSEKHAGRRTYNAGELVSVRYNDPDIGYSIQIDNIVAMNTLEAEFKQQLLDMPAEKQGLILALIKIATVETNAAVLFDKLGIIACSALTGDQEYEFNLSSVGLTLRRVAYVPGTYREANREDVWFSQDFTDVARLLYQYDLDAEFAELLVRGKQVIRNSRSHRRVNGIFNSMITVKSGEVGTAKGDKKLAAQLKVNEAFK